MKITILPLCLLAFLFTFPTRTFVAEANAATITVNSVMDTGVVADEQCTLREAILNANRDIQPTADCALGSGSDTIDFSDSLANQTIILTSQLIITSNITIDAQAAPGLSVSGNDLCRVFAISANGVVVMDGFRLINGNGNGFDGGGAISNLGDLRLTNMVIQTNAGNGLGGGIRTDGAASRLTINGGSILGNTASGGGAIYSNGSIINLTFVTISGNIATNSGGAIEANGGTLNITGGSVTGNTATNYGGGGIATSNTTTLTVTNASITNNHTDGSTGRGGGMVIVGNSTIINSTVSGNTAQRSGGGVYFAGIGTHSITGTTLSGNAAGGGEWGGGGLLNSADTVNISNSTISGNSSGCDCGGGGITAYNGSTTNLRNVTIANNTATAGPGGGIVSFIPGYPRGTINIGNTIVADNTATSNPDVNGAIVSQGFNLIRNRGTSTGYVASDLPNGSSPMLEALGNNGGLTRTHRLLSASAAIETGSNALAVNPASGAALTTDQRGAGFARIVDADGNGTATVDIGAFEALQGQLAITISGTISYATAPAKLVSGVNLNATGTSALSATTSNSGFYQLFGFTSGGDYTVTPSKSGNINGITAFDATLVLRCVAAGNACTLTDNQKIAANTDGDINITAFDATQILRFVAANGQNQNTGQIGNWKFDPINRPYSNLTGSQSNQNYTAFLVGEVDGDWTP